jgi:prolipoprotein diacylglyceryltransferase
MSLHGVFAALGFVAGAIYTTKLLNERGFSGEAFQSVLTWALVGSLLGARYFTAPAALMDGVPILTALNPVSGNFSIMGGFAGGILVGWWRMRKVGLDRLPTFDSASYGLAIGTIVGRIGDLAIVEHLGSATTMPWGYGIRPGYDVAPMHDALECAAVPLGQQFCGVYHHAAMYDMIGAIILFFVLDAGAKTLQPPLRPAVFVLDRLVRTAALRARLSPLWLGRRHDRCLHLEPGERPRRVRTRCWDVHLVRPIPAEGVGRER